MLSIKSIENYELNNEQKNYIINQGLKYIEENNDKFYCVDCKKYIKNFQSHIGTKSHMKNLRHFH